MPARKGPKDVSEVDKPCQLYYGGGGRWARMNSRKRLSKSLPDFKRAD